MVFDVSNASEPVQLSCVNLAGISAASANEGESVPVWQRMGLTSDDTIFHLAVPDICNALNQMIRDAGSSLDTSNANSVLLIVHEDKTAHIWVNGAATSLTVAFKSPKGPGEPVFSTDIVDIIGIRFPAVDILPTDRVLYLFRHAWRFGLYFDFTSDGELDVSKLERQIGQVYRRIAYYHLYDAIETDTVYSTMLAAGWFPFADLIGDQISHIISAFKGHQKIEHAEAAVLKSYDSQYLDRILNRWMTHPIMLQKQLIFTSAINAFKNQDYVSTIKIVLTEIEGILCLSYRAKHGKGAKLDKLLSYISELASKKTGDSHTLLLSKDFSQYLKRHTFAPSDARNAIGRAGSRHSVGHGAAGDDAYTAVRALQAILTLDQIVFFLRE